MECILAGMAAARALDRVGGQPRIDQKIKRIISLAATLYSSEKYTTNQKCEQLHIGSKATH